MSTAAELFALARQQHKVGSLAQAEMQCQQTLQADPNFADAHHLMGLLALQTGRFQDAVTCIRRALALNPQAEHYHSNLGLAQQALGHMDDALASFQEAVRLQPHFADGYRNIGKVLWRQGRAGEALAKFREAVRINPQFAEGHNSLGIALQEQGDTKAAIACFRRAIQINPHFAEALNNLGNSHEQRDDLDEALHCFEKAIELKPVFAGAHNNLGRVYLRQGRLELAARSFRQAMAFQPGLAEVQSNLVACSVYDPDADPDRVFAEHCRWGQKLEALHEAERDAYSVGHAKRDDANPERRLRIGYVSPDFRFHPLARYLEPILAHHDARQVEVFCYAEVARTDAVTMRLQGLVLNWRSTCGLSDSQVAGMIDSDRIDILVDLAGHTRNNRLAVFARKPAPVQASFLGYLNTTGLRCIDYRLTDEILDPPGQPVSDTEALVRLSEGMCCFAPPLDAPPVAPLPALRSSHLTFGSLSNLIKLNRRVFDVWCLVLKAVPTARLLMFHHTLKGGALDFIRREFMDRGVARERLDLRQGSLEPGYLSVYSEIDVSLDTFPCTGGVTTCESLWMGVPVLSLCGMRPAGRNSAALLARIGLGHWAVDSPEQFCAFALDLANDLPQLSQLRAVLRERMTAKLCDGHRFTRALEDAYRTMWRRWCGKCR
jgi:protein O-GlcNAc transferase